MFINSHGISLIIVSDLLSISRVLAAPQRTTTGAIDFTRPWLQGSSGGLPLVSKRCWSDYNRARYCCPANMCTHLSGYKPCNFSNAWGCCRTLPLPTPVEPEPPKESKTPSKVLDGLQSITSAIDTVGSQTTSANQVARNIELAIQEVKGTTLTLQSTPKFGEEDSRRAESSLTILSNHVGNAMAKLNYRRSQIQAQTTIMALKAFSSNIDILCKSLMEQVVESYKINQDLSRKAIVNYIEDTANYLKI